MTRKGQTEAKKRPAKSAAQKKRTKPRRPGKKKGKIAAWMHRWGISTRFAVGFIVVVILILLGAGLIREQFASGPSVENGSPVKERELARRDPETATRQIGTDRTRETGKTHETREPVFPPPNEHVADAPSRPSRYMSVGEQLFEEQSTDRLEDAVKRVDGLLLEALDAQGLPYSVHMSNVEWREHAGDMYHFQRLLILFEGAGGGKDQAVNRLRRILDAKFEHTDPATSLTELTENRWYVSISGIATHELLFAAERTEAPAASERKARLVILIDDIGESKAMLREFLALDIPMAFAVLPHSTHARECAGIISRAGHELLLHHPMEPERFPAVKPGPGAVYAKDNEARIAAVLEDNMARVPGIKGLNNHMGSKFTGNARAVDLFLRAMSGKGLFVVDSLTSPDSKLYNAAKRMGIKAYRRDVFLDDVSDRASIRHELEKAARLAQTQGHALAIGHPRPETLAVLKEWLKTDARGITFSRLEDL